MSFSVALRGHTSRLVRAGLKGRCRGTNIPGAWALEPPRAPGRLHGRLNVGATIVTTDAAYMLVTRKRAQGPARIAPSSSSGQQTELRRLTRRRPWALLQPPGSSALPPSEVAAPAKAPSRGVRCLPGSRSGSQGPARRTRALVAAVSPSQVAQTPARQARDTYRHGGNG
jgi:hypothetical protein